MKNTPLILSIIALVAVAALGIIQLTGDSTNKAKSSDEATEAVATKGAIVYFNLDQVLEEYDMANELRSAVESKVSSIQEEVNRRGNRLQSDVNSFNDKINKGLITRSVAEQQSQKLSQQQADFQNYAAQKEQEIAEEQQVMLNQIGDAIHAFLEKFNAEKQYAMIIATQGDILPQPVAMGDPSLDITEEILAGLNDEYIKNKAAQNN
ncbi:MAG: OmpH family outer membrane protein [Bacteroidales bacterium]|nr:OmpH family outer membrane protein [Bacteroidales bacterium]MBQ6577583.1 OmpH family outer membrane protein [Bacteroidales bacterium]